jgi:adenosylhomocysteinase
MRASSAQEQHDFDRYLEWIRRNMPLTRQAAAALPDLSGLRLACNMHLDPKMLPFIEAVTERGGEIHLSPCNPDTVDDGLIRAARELGADAHAWSGMSREQWTEAVTAALAWDPTHLCEMGAELSSALYGTSPLVPGRSLREEGYGARIRAGMEATGSGISRLEAIPAGRLAHPVFNWDDVPVKEGLHNRHMVGITAWHTFFERTGLTLHGKRVVVVGYGSVGRGVAAAARAYGGTVAVAEAEPGRGWEAAYAGYPVGTLPEIARGADVVVTATGHEAVVNLETVRSLADGAFLLNVGHVANEIATEPLQPYRGEEIIPMVREYRIDGRAVYLLAEGSMVNLAAGRGDSINAFDVTLAVMTATLGHMVRASDEPKAGRLLRSNGPGGPAGAAPGASDTPVAAPTPGIHPVPAKVWRAAVADG